MLFPLFFYLVDTALALIENMTALPGHNIQNPLPIEHALLEKVKKKT